MIMLLNGATLDGKNTTTESERDIHPLWCTVVSGQINLRSTSVQVLHHQEKKSCFLP
jgi:hypothetical protein